MSGEAQNIDALSPMESSLEAWTSLTAHEDAGEAPLGGSADEARVELREVTANNVRAICRLAVARSQSRFVAPNAVSLAEALFEPKAWYRAIYAGDAPVGFAMLSIDTATPMYYLWRLMIADGYQHRGYGRAAIAAIVEHVRTLPGAAGLLVSWVPAEGGPEAFYLSLGFVPTGEVHEGEIEARLELGPEA